MEVQHLRQLVGGDDHLLIVGLNPRAEVVEENNRDNGHEKAGCGGDQRFADARRDDRRGRVTLERDVVEGPNDAQDRAEEADERRDDGDGSDDAQVALQSIQMLHQRYRERICDVGAILVAALQAELENFRKHALVLPADLDGARDVVLRDPGPQLAQQFLAVTMLLGEEHETLDNDRYRRDRTDEQADHRRPTSLDEAYETAKIIHALRRLQRFRIGFTQMKATPNPRREVRLFTPGARLACGQKTPSPSGAGRSFSADPLDRRLDLRRQVGIAVFLSCVIGLL